MCDKDEVLLSSAVSVPVPQKIKTRHQRQCSDASLSNFDSLHARNVNNSKGVIRRCCLSYRQSMWSHKFWMGFTASTWGFLSSVERAVILPTLWLYLNNWGSEYAQMYYGITLAAFSLSILVMTPLYGYAAHAGVRVKSLLLFANFMEIIGNIFYLFAPTPLAVMIGRLISGIGASCEPPLYADIARATNRDERTTYIIVLLLTRQIGLIFGPTFTLLMDKIDYRMANLTISVYNGPGLLMAVLWLFHSFIILYFYPNVDRNGRLCFTDSSYCAFCNRDTWFHPNDEMLEDSRPILNESSDSLNYINVSIFSNSLKPYRSCAIQTLYIITFATYFCFIGLEAVLPPVVNRIFNWTEVETSYVYLGASVLIILVVILLRFLNNFYSDRVLLLSGLVIMVASYMWLTVVIYFLPSLSGRVGIPLTLMGIFIHVVGLPFAFAYSESLYTKLAPISDMDRAQSIFRTVVNIAFLIGPYVSGSLINTPTWVFFSMTVISVIPTFLVCYSYKEFNVTDRPPSPVDLETAKQS